MKPDFGALIAAYQRLSPRERGMLSLAAGTVLLIGLYSLVWQPLATGRVNVKRRIVAKQRELVEIQEMRRDYFELVRQFEAGEIILMKNRDFSLFPHIESAVGQVVSRDHIQSMSPQSKVIADAYKEESVELRLQDVSLDQLVDLLYRIEKGEQPLRVTRLQVKKRTKDPYRFDVNATVSMLEAVGG